MTEAGLADSKLFLPYDKWAEAVVVASFTGLAGLYPHMKGIFHMTPSIADTILKETFSSLCSQARRAVIAQEVAELSKMEVQCGHTELYRQLVQKPASRAALAFLMTAVFGGCIAMCSEEHVFDVVNGLKKVSELIRLGALLRMTREFVPVFHVGPVAEVCACCCACMLCMLCLPACCRWCLFFCISQPSRLLYVLVFCDRRIC